MPRKFKEIFNDFNCEITDRDRHYRSISHLHDPISVANKKAALENSKPRKAFNARRNLHRGKQKALSPCKIYSPEELAQFNTERK